MAKSPWSVALRKTALVVSARPVTWQESALRGSLQEVRNRNLASELLFNPDVYEQDQSRQERPTRADDFRLSAIARARHLCIARIRLFPQRRLGD